jgi:hypothetical protein
VTKVRLVDEDLHAVPLNYRNRDPARSGVDVSPKSSMISCRDKYLLVENLHSLEGLPTIGSV